jgi:hypothetical protein
MFADHQRVYLQNYVVFGYLWDNYSLNLASAYSLSKLSFAAIIGMLLFLKTSNKKE